jgi:hypothetical protein
VHGGAAGGPQCNAPDAASGLHPNGSRSEQFYTYMVRREMQATEDRILERVLVGADDQVCRGLCVHVSRLLRVACTRHLERRCNALGEETRLSGWVVAQMRLAERRILHNVNCSMARVSSLLTNRWLCKTYGAARLRDIVSFACVVRQAVAEMCVYARQAEAEVGCEQ